jgi:hypothetical protein
MRSTSASSIVKSLLTVVLAALAGSATATDEWDDAVVKDNTALATRNELQRNQWQTHDLEAIGGVADQDWFVVPTSSYRAHQIYVSEITPDTPIDNADFLELYDATGTTLIATSTAGPNATGKVIRWWSDAATSFRVRVKGGTATSSTSRYSILFSESTMYCPRYNNSGTQVSVLMIQNTTNGTCNVGVGFFDESGANVGNHGANVNPYGMLVLAAGSVPGVNATKGSVQIQPNTCSPSALKAKMVALEPATGFSFDTLCERR